MKLAVLAVCCAVSSMVCQAAGREGVVRLYERAGVAGEAIRLSDFLPPDAPTALRSAAAAINLGCSPQLSSIRVLSREQVLYRIKEHTGLLEQISVPERVTVTRQGWPIAAASVRQAILDFAAKQNWGQDLSFPPEFAISGRAVALIHDPELKVESSEQDSLRDELKFVIRCVKREVCGTFLVATGLPQNFLDGKRAHTGPGVKASPRIQQEILAHAGQPAMLSMDSGNMHISLRVICLERGSLGQTIRAREANSRRVFHAQVVGAGHLRANL